MKNIVHVACALVVLLASAGALGGCGGGTDSSAPLGGDDPSTDDTGDDENDSSDASVHKPTDAGKAPDAPKVDSAPPHDAGAPVCVSACTADLDCQNSCPAAPSGKNCCDKATKACFTAQSTTCPISQDDDGGVGVY